MSAVAMVVMTWSHNDPVAASRYVSTLRPGTARDAAISALLNTSRESDPSLLRLVETIGDEQTRSQAKLSYVYRLARFDAAAAEAMLDDMNLNDEERRQFEQFLQNYRGRMSYD
jgi:hypothetical protein